MKYKLTIIKYEENKNYEAELAKQKEDESNSRYYSNRNWEDGKRECPSKETAERSLEVFLTEDEYKKFKAEIIKLYQ